MSITITEKKPAFRVSVREALICFIASMSEGVATYEQDITKLPVLKSVDVTPDTSEKKIYASGIVYAQTSRTSGAELGVGAVALPRDIVRKAIGAVLGTNQALSYETTSPTLAEFGFGFITDKSDGGQEYRWYPRCTLTVADESFATSDDDDPDPEETYTILALPTDEKVMRVVYDTTLVVAGKAPLTAQAFYEAQPYTVEQITALGASETAG